MKITYHPHCPATYQHALRNEELNVDAIAFSPDRVVVLQSQHTPYFPGLLLTDHDQIHLQLKRVSVTIELP